MNEFAALVELGDIADEVAQMGGKVEERLCGVHIEPRLQEWRDSHGY